ncbi:MAG: cation:proton antiporter, partial [Candidatus Woesearchaeota archaeon]
MQRDKNIWYYLFTLLLFASIVTIFYSTIVSGQESNGHGNGHEGFALTFFFIVILLLGAKLSSLVERFGQPAVLGELLTGVLLGNLVLLGFGFFEPIKHDIIIAFLAELGVVILLFQIGLESNIKDMAKVGLRAFLVAIVGVITPFVLGTFIVGPWLLPNERFHTYLFIGAALTA